MARISRSPLYTFKVVLGAAGKQVLRRGRSWLAVADSVRRSIIVTTVKLHHPGAAGSTTKAKVAFSALMALLGRKPGQRLRLVHRHVRRGTGVRRLRPHAGDLGAVGVGRACTSLHLSSAASFCRGPSAILAALFAVQRRGRLLLGRFLGPVMAVSFMMLALLGLSGIAEYATVIGPSDAGSGPASSSFPIVATSCMVILGSVFLCVTGARLSDLASSDRRRSGSSAGASFPALRSSIMRQPDDRDRRRAARRKFGGHGADNLPSFDPLARFGSACRCRRRSQLASGLPRWREPSCPPTC